MDIAVYRAPRLAFHRAVSAKEPRAWINISWPDGGTVSLNFHIWDGDVTRYKQAVAAFNSVAAQSDKAPEYDRTTQLANKILDDNSRDPDSDLSMLARQFLRVTGQA